MNPREQALENHFWPIFTALVDSGRLVDARPKDGIIVIMGISTGHRIKKPSATYKHEPCPWQQGPGLLFT